MEDNWNVLQSKMRRWKNNLIDLTKRNRLLSFKDNSSTVVQFDSDMNELYDLLVRDRALRVSTIVNLDKYYRKTNRKKKSTEATELETVDEQDREDGNVDRTEIAKSRLEKNLNKIRLKAKSSIDEKGVNTLFIAFGMLAWKESKDSDIVLKSPILLLPATLSRETSKHPYYIQKHDDDLTFNPTLLQKLKVDFGIEIPNLAEVAEGQESNSLSEIIDALQPHLSDYDDWKITHDSYLGLFSFNKLVMYKDFEQYEDMIAQHDIVQKLAGIMPDDGFIHGLSEESIRDHDRKASSVDNFQILDADSSQQEAILAANKGASFIIQGPPGTGKSQTIANIIAENLAHGKRVLFVSEKKAALEVVKKRIDSQNLGDFCLELHSNNANKKEVLQELYRTLTVKSSPSRQQMQYDVLDKTKHRLNSYVDALHTKVEPLGFSPFYVHGELARLYDVDELVFSIENLPGITVSKLDQIKDLLHHVGEYNDVIAHYHDHLWKPAVPKRFSFELQSDIAAKFPRLANNLGPVIEKFHETAQSVNLNWVCSLKNIEKLQQLHDLLRYIPDIPIEWLRSSQDSSHYRAKCEEALRMFEKHAQKKRELESLYEEQALALNLDELEFAVTKKHQAELQEHIQNPTQYSDKLVQGELDYVEVLQRLDSLLLELDDIRQFVASSCGMEFEDFTMESAFAMFTVLQTLQTNRLATEKWFSFEDFDKLQRVLNETRMKIEECTKEKNQLSSKFDLEILGHDDLDGTLRRFSTDYTGFFRFLKKSYRQDRKVFQFHLKEKAKLKYDDLVQDVKLMGRIREKESWMKENEAELQAWLGKGYIKEETNWEQLQENMQAVNNIHAMLLSLNLFTPEVKGLLTFSNIHQLESFKGYSKQLENVISDLKNVAVQVEVFTKISNPVTNQTVNIPAMHETVRKLIDVSTDIIKSAQSMTSLSVQGKKIGLVQLVNDIQLAKELVTLKREIECNRENYTTLFGELFKGYETQWEDVQQAIKWRQDLRELMENNIPDGVVAVIEHQDDEMHTSYLKNCADLRRYRDKCANDLKFFCSVIKPDAKMYDGEALRDASLEVVRSRLGVFSEYSYQLEEWLGLQNLIKESMDLGIFDFLQEVINLRLTTYSFEQLFFKRFYKLWLDYAYLQLPSLSHFRVEQHVGYIETFQGLDAKQLEVNGARIHEMLNKNKELYLSTSGSRASQVHVLTREVQKQKRHKAIRVLFSQIPDLLLTLKPCMMMSPMSVSQFIDPTVFQFDVAIFDEASQICSEDAIGSIFRAKRILIAGDNKQLPPTKFFGTSVEEDEEFIDEDDTSADIFESILDESATFMPVVPLKWHYRSKHESLIAFSNQEIYDNQLYTFPSSTNDKNDGVSLVYVPDGVYDRSGSRRNLVEAKRVASLVFEHLKQSPRRTLGVIAFSEAQQEVIRDQVDYLRNQHPEFEEFFADDHQDAFFIKNLENVQGDERDTIIFSVGYGKDQQGTLHYNFGPLNKPGGERRLNVAVTRAKYEVKLVSSILHTDLDDTKLSKRGPQLLKSYLYYAKTGGQMAVTTGLMNDGEFDSPFEKDVYEALTARGLTLRKQVGCSSYRIDLAVVDPSRPGSYLMGIECDGAMYHSTKTARDRDRLRQQVLESLGWKIHRIWSQDWFKRKRDEIDKIMQVVAKTTIGVY